MDFEERVQLVRDRICTVKKLIENRDLFYFDVKDRYVNKFQVTNPYVHYSGLKNYLLLTCFDILGQNLEWKDFNSWLNSKSKKSEREKIFEKHKYLEFSERIKKVNEEYLLIYGVRRSFDNFVLNHLSEENRKKLYNSIKAQKKVRDSEYIPGKGIRVGGSEKIEISDSEKLKLLFKVRNSFTHKGVPIGSLSEISFEKASKILAVHNINFTHSFVIYRELVKKEHLSYIFFGWPNLLIEILEDYLKSFPETKKGPFE